MEGVNLVVLTGRLGADPRVGKTKGGSDFAVMSLATNHSYTDRKTQERKERTEWHRVVGYGPRAKLIADYLRKGSPVQIVGELRTRHWRDEELDVERWTTEVVVSRVVFLPDPNRPAPEKDTSGRAARPPEPPETEDDDVPF